MTQEYVLEAERSTVLLLHHGDMYEGRLPEGVSLRRWSNATSPTYSAASSLKIGNKCQKVRGTWWCNSDSKGRRACLSSHHRHRYHRINHETKVGEQVAEWRGPKDRHWLRWGRSCGLGKEYSAWMPVDFASILDHQERRSSRQQAWRRSLLRSKVGSGPAWIESLEHDNRMLSPMLYRAIAMGKENEIPRSKSKYASSKRSRPLCHQPLPWRQETFQCHLHKISPLQNTACESRIGTST